MVDPARSRSSDRTRSLILDLIRAAGHVSRVELAVKTGLTEATISTVVRRAIDDGLVIETGPGVSTGGKRRTLLALNSISRHAVGVSLARERMHFAITDLTGTVLDSSSTEGAMDADPDTVAERISAEIERLMRSNAIDRDGVVGIGVASPGPLDCAVGELRGVQPTPAWQGYALEEKLEQLTGLHTVLDNDATCAALGEYWTSRREAPAPVSATVYMADGIGGGILIDGRVFHGSSSNAGEVGHITLDVNGPVCDCGARGCVEILAKPAAVAAAARQNEALRQRIDAGDGGMSDRDLFDRVARAAMAGDADAVQLIEASAHHLGSGIVSMSNILDLDEVSLSGPSFAIAGEIYARVIRERLASGTFMRAIHPVEVRISNIGVEAAAVGAAALIMQHQITPHSALASRRLR